MNEIKPYSLTVVTDGNSDLGYEIVYIKDSQNDYNYSQKVRSIFLVEVRINFLNDSESPVPNNKRSLIWWGVDQEKFVIKTLGLLGKQFYDRRILFSLTYVYLAPTS